MNGSIPRKARSVEAPLDRLRQAHPWPDRRPDVPEDWHGWLQPGTAWMLSSHLGPATRLVVECGSWLGLSARTILRAAPRAVLVCCDHWQGSPEHQPGTQHDDWSRRLATLHETFLRNLWRWRDRVIPVRADSLDGLAEVRDAGLVPELVYLDGEHSFDRVSRELAFLAEHWPLAVVVGDDYSELEVARAAHAHAQQTGRSMISNGSSFCFEP